MKNFDPSHIDDKNRILVNVEELVIGMYISELDKPWEDSPFLFQGFVVQNQDILQQLKDECDYVYVDAAKINKPNIPRSRSSSHGLKSKKNSLATQNKNDSVEKLIHKTNKLSTKNKLSSILNSLSARIKNKPSIEKEKVFLKDFLRSNIKAEEIQPPEKIKPFEQEIDEAQQIHSKVNKIIQTYMSELKQGGVLDIHIANSAVRECMHSITRSPDALMLMTHMKNKDKKLWDHSMNSCVLAICFGRYLNLVEDELMVLGLCGLLHDIGSLLIPSEILNKPGELTDAEQKVMRSHTLLGKKILSTNSKIKLTSIIANVALNHHERVDGRGYPRGLSSNQLTPYTKMISIIDAYDSLTSESSYEFSKTHFEAISILRSKTNTFYDEKLVNCFIQSLGAYPAGSLVEMNSGEIAMVIEVNQQQRLKPKIIVLSDAKKNPIPEIKIDLADEFNYESAESYAIKNFIHPDNCTFDIDQYYQYGVIQQSLAKAA